MMQPFKIIKSRYITEKSTVLEQLKDSNSNPCLARCEKPKYVFLVDQTACKQEIAAAVEEIYKKNKVKVVQVNTIRVKPKRAKRGRGKGRPGMSAGFKKAIVTLEAGDAIEEL
jgi:large subunit ribosomal protein L23